MMLHRFVTLGLLAAAMTLGPVAVATASNNNQILLSATGISTTVGPGGFWLWSQPGSNPYQNDGRGNVYFYALPLQKPVIVSNVVLNGATVTEHVASNDGSIACDFSATETSRPSNGHGVNGVVSFTCTAPSGASATNVPATVRISNF